MTSDTPPVLQPRPDSGDQIDVIERFVEVAFKSCLLRPLMVGSVGQAAERDDGGMALSMKTTQLAEKLEPIHPRHPQVAQHQIDVL